MPKNSVKGAGRIRQVTNKTVWERGDFYAKMYGVEGTLSAGIAALDLLDFEGREKAVKIAKGIAEEKYQQKRCEQEPGVCHIKTAAKVLKYASVRYKLLSKEDKEALDELRRALGPEPKKRGVKTS